MEFFLNLVKNLLVKNLIFMKIAHIFSFFALFALMSCAIQTSFDYDRNVNFNQYKTYSFHQISIDSLAMNSLDKSRIINAVKEEMSSKGFVLSETPDIIIDIIASSKRIIEADNYTDGFYYPGMWYDWGPYWNNVYYTSYREGKLIFNIVDVQKKILVWQGIGEGIDLSDLNTKEKQIKKAVQLVFRHFPSNIKK